MRPDTTRSQPALLEWRPRMRRPLMGLAAATAFTLGGCNLDVTNPNSPSPLGALENPRDAIIRQVVGVFATYRANRAEQIRDLGSYGRETYYMFITDGRWITGPYRDWRQNNAFTAGSPWAVPDAHYRNAYQTIKTINSTPNSPEGAPTALTSG